MSLNPSKMDNLADKIDTQAEEARLEVEKAEEKAKEVKTVTTKKK